MSGLPHTESSGSRKLTIAVVTEASDQGIQTYSCPAIEMEGRAGSLILWRRSSKPIRVPYGWIYWLRFKQIEVPA